MAIETIKSTPSGVPPRAILQVEPEAFRKNYNRRPFMFEHRLNEHPLMQLEALLELAHRLPPDQVRHSRGKRGFDVDFDDDLRTRRHKLTLDQVFEDLPGADAYVMLHRPDVDPRYRDLLLTALADLRGLVEPVDPGMCDEAAYIFLASPGAVTPYHMDREMNFLCQVSGSKEVRLWDQDDRSILAPQEIDTLFAREDLPKPAYQPEYGEKAMTFTLSPGTGVHQPLLAPHAVTRAHMTIRACWIASKSGPTAVFAASARGCARPDYYQAQVRSASQCAAHSKTDRHAPAAATMVR